MIHLINSVFLTGIFPTSLKYSILRPVFKGGTDHSHNNYRPISIVPSLSKVLEKIIFKRIYGFLSGNGFFSSAQFGFLPRRSTEMGLFVCFVICLGTGRVHLFRLICERLLIRWITHYFWESCTRLVLGVWI